MKVALVLEELKSTIVAGLKHPNSHLPKGRPSLSLQDEVQLINIAKLSGAEYQVNY